MNSAPTAEEKVIFGQLNQVSKELAELSCNSVFDCTVDIIVQDQHGQIVLNKLAVVNHETQSIPLDVSKVNDGEYHAWISVGKDTFLRNLKIKRQTASSSGVKSLFARLFT